MRRINYQLAVLFACAVTSWSAFASGKAAGAADAFFSKNSATIPFITERLDTFLCSAKQIDLEAVIVLGYAERSEEAAQQLSLLRAENVKELLIREGIPEKKIYVEGKGLDKQANDNSPEKKRRVDLEFVGMHNPDIPVKDCRDAWGKRFVGLPSNEAVSVARTLVRDGFVSSHTPAAAAISEKRLDLLNRLLEGPDSIRLDTESRVSLMLEAVTKGDTQYFERLVFFGIKIEEFKSRDLPIIWAECDYFSPKLSELQRIAMIERLIAWGAKPKGISCAAGENRIKLVELLLANGAKPDYPKSNPPIVAGGKHPTIVRMLMNAGADYLAKSDNGTTLFHTYIFNNPREVSWFVELGLDINTKNKSGITPIQEAISYASPEVLDAFVANGAVISDVSESLIVRALRNIAGLAWVINAGVPLDRPKNVANLVAAKGDAAVSVIDALQRRGVNLRELDRNGETPLRSAIRSLSPVLVKRLVEYGAVNQQGEAVRAMEYAERQPIKLRPETCVSCIRPRGWFEEQIRILNDEKSLLDRQQRRDRIIDILKAADAL